METKSYILSTRISTVKLKTNEILEIDIQEDQNFSSEDMRDLIDAAYKIGSGKKFKNLINVGAYTVPDLAAIKFSCSKKGSKYKIADASIIHTLAQKIIATFYLRMNKPAVPTKFFNNATDAETWLLAI